MCACVCNVMLLIIALITLNIEKYTHFAWQDQLDVRLLHFQILLIPSSFLRFLLVILSSGLNSFISFFSSFLSCFLSPLLLALPLLLFLSYTCNTICGSAVQAKQRDIMIYVSCLYQVSCNLTHHCTELETLR